MLPKSDVGSKDNVTERERRDGGEDELQGKKEGRYMVGM